MWAWRSQAKCSPSSRYSLNTDGRNECSTQEWRLLEWSLRTYWYFWAQGTNKCFLNKWVTTWRRFPPGTTCKQGVWTAEMSWEAFTRHSSFSRSLDGTGGAGTHTHTCAAGPHAHESSDPVWPSEPGTGCCPTLLWYCSIWVMILIFGW